MRIGFLLGAGVSIPAGMPCTQELTSAVLRVENYHEWKDGRFCEGGPQALPDHLQPSRLWTALLKKLQEHCQSYFVDYKSRPVNYEDLFFAASQIEEHLLGEYENPVIEAFTEALLKDLPGVCGREQLRDSATRACNYIRDVVESKLRREPASPNHLTCLVDAMRDETLEGCDIFTLNHDLLIEKLLIRHEIPFDDGFGDPDKDVAWWKRSAFTRGQPHYFLKLHGSIDWFDYPGKGLAKVLIDDYEHACDGKGELLVLPDRPRMLVGTFNKIRDYFEEPYAELIATFRRQMKEIGTLVVSGYSFGDKGVNEVLSRWMRSDDRAKLVVLAGDEHECFKTARGAIIKLLEDYPGRIRVYSPYLSGYKWQNLRAHLT